MSTILAYGSKVSTEPWGAYDLMAALESLGARKDDVQIGSIAWHLRDHVTSENVDEVFEFMRDRRWRYLWKAVWQEMNDLDEVKARHALWMRRETIHS